ncbi:USP domain-containing protein, partial [Haematococcus lacustris]
MVNKKGKGRKTGKGPQKSAKKPAADGQKDLLQTPQDRADAVRPLWESLSQDDRVSVLSVPVTTLKQKAQHLVEAARQQAEADSELDFIGLPPETTLEDVLDEGINRLRERSSWKLWTWPLDQSEFTDSEAFRQHIADKAIKEELHKFLPRDDPKAPERPAEEAFRKRMTDLLARIQQLTQRSFDEVAAA